MNTRTNARRAFLSSIVALVLCLTMLMGTTFAWFTDTASVNVNKIVAGTLDIDLVDGENNSLKGETIGFVNATEAALWEPGCRYTLETVKLVNNGSLNAKFKVVITAVKGTDDKADLADVIDVYEGNYAEGTATKLGTLRGLLSNNGVIKEGVIAPKETLNFGTLTLVMQETAGNEYQGCSLDGVAVTVFAAQAEAESDSFGTEYDKYAEYDKTTLVVTAEQLKKMLNELADAGSGDGSITIPSNIKLAEGETWTPVVVDGYNGAGVITVNGNGSTIYNLTAPLFAGGFAGKSGIIIKDLTIADSKIVSTNTLGSGAFIETIDSMPIITLENCHLIDSTVTGSRTGGLIGWTAGYNNTNDGPVKTYVTIKNCSVVGCTIDGGSESVGAINGHAGNNAWTYTTIENCVVKNNTLIGGNGKTGVILGTANVGEVTINNCTMEGNTINGAESVSVYGRFVPGTTGKLTIDGAEIK